MIRMLVLYGADLDGYVPYPYFVLDGEKLSFLEFAIQFAKDVELIKLLAENGAKINNVDDDGNTHLILAVEQHHKMPGVCIDQGKLQHD